MHPIAAFFNEIVFQASRFAAAGLSTVLGLRAAGLIALQAGSPLLWVAANAIACGLCLQSYLNRRRYPRGSHSPFNRHGRKTDKPVWRTIPAGTTLLLDTNVLMCPDDCIRSWFGFLLHNAEKNRWRIVILGAVYEEIIHHLKHGTEAKARDARLARNRIELLGDSLGDRLEMEGLSRAAVFPTADRYADPQLIDYICAHKRTILFTFDNDLKIRCKQHLRRTQPQNRVFSEEDFDA